MFTKISQEFGYILCTVPYEPFDLLQIRLPFEDLGGKPGW